MAPIVEEVARDYAERIRFAKVDVENAGEIAMRYNVYGIPTFIIFKGGEEKGRRSDLIMSKDDLVRFIDNTLAALTKTFH